MKFKVIFRRPKALTKYYKSFYLCFSFHSTYSIIICKSIKSWNIRDDVWVNKITCTFEQNVYFIYFNAANVGTMNKNDE